MAVLLTITLYYLLLFFPTTSKVIFSSRYSLNVYSLNFLVVFQSFGKRKNNYFLFFSLFIYLFSFLTTGIHNFIESNKFIKSVNLDSAKIFLPFKRLSRGN